MSSVCERVKTHFDTQVVNLTEFTKDSGRWHSTLVGQGLGLGFDYVLPRSISHLPPMKYFISPLCRGIYALGCMIILGIVGTIYHALAMGCYKIMQKRQKVEEKKNGEQSKVQKNCEKYEEHKVSLIVDSLSFASLIFGIGEVAAILYAIDAKKGTGLALTVPWKVAQLAFPDYD